MNRIIATASAGVIAAALALGGATLPAMADELPPVDPPIVEVVTPEEAVTPDEAAPEETPVVETLVVEETKEPDVGYGLALWKADDDGGDPLWPQTLVTYIQQAEPDLDALDYLATCGTYQADLYKDDATTATLIAGGHLYGPSNPTESWPGDDGYQSSFAKQWTVTEGCEEPEPPVEPTECEAFTGLPLATEADPQGWGDLKNGTWTADGIQLTATDTEEAYAYVAVDNIPLSSTVNGLTTHGTGTAVAVIIHTDVANVHYESDGQYWTMSGPGLFPETSPGFWSTYDLSEMLQEAYIDEVAVWVNPGESFLLQSQDYPCFNQPFGAVTATPPTTTPPGELAYTGNEGLVTFGIGALLTLLGAAGVLVRRFSLQ